MSSRFDARLWAKAGQGGSDSKQEKKKELAVSAGERLQDTKPENTQRILGVQCMVLA